MKLNKTANTHTSFIYIIINTWVVLSCFKVSLMCHESLFEARIDAMLYKAMKLGGE